MSEKDNVIREISYCILKLINSKQWWLHSTIGKLMSNQWRKGLNTIQNIEIEKGFKILTPTQEMC